MGRFSIATFDCWRICAHCSHFGLFLEIVVAKKLGTPHSTWPTTWKIFWVLHFENPISLPIVDSIRKTLIISVCWLVSPLIATDSHCSEKYESQLGWFFPIYKYIYIYMESHKSHVPNHQPALLIATDSHTPTSHPRLIQVYTHPHIISRTAPRSAAARMPLDGLPFTPSLYASMSSGESGQQTRPMN